MRKLWILLLAYLLILPTGAMAQGEGCPTDFAGFAPPRLSVGVQGIVLPGSPNRVRNAPSTNGEIITEMPAGTEFKVLAGPACNNGIVWWQVEVGEDIGWTAESVDGEFFLQPIPGSVRVPEVPPVPADAPTLPNVVLDSSAVHLAFTRAETLLIAVTAEPQKVDMWDLDTGSSFELSFGPQDSPIMYYVEKLQPDGMGGDVIVTGDIQGRIFLWDPFFFTYTEEPIEAALLDAYFPVYAASPATDLNYVAIGGCFEAARNLGCSLGGVEVYDIATVTDGEVELAFEVSGHEAEITAMDISADNTTLATAAADGSIILWSLADGEQVVTFNATDQLITDLTFTPDGEGIVIGACLVSQGEVCLVGGVTRVDRTGAVQWQAAAHQGEVNAIDVNVDGTRVATGGMDGIVRIWRMDTGELETTFAPNGYTGISAVRFFDQFNEIAIAGNSEIGIFPLP